MRTFSIGWVIIAACFLAGLSVYILQNSQSETPVKIVQNFFSFCADGKIDKAKSLTSKMVRIDEEREYEIKAEIEESSFDFARVNETIKQKLKLEKVLESKTEKYRARVLVLAKDKAFSYKISLCLSRDLKTGNWKINSNRLFLDDWDFESTYKEDTCF